MSRRVTALFALTLAAGCSVAATDDVGQDTEQHFSSNQATLLEFDFDGEVLTTSSFGNGKQQIQDQLIYTMGHLNTDDSVGRLDKLEITNIVKTPAANGQTLLRYHAKLPVAWGSKTNLPTTYAFTLPNSVAFDALEAFTSKYKEECVDFGAHEVSTGNMWYYYRPRNSGCSLADADVLKVTAQVTKSQVNTTGKYPEYTKVWEDNSLDVVAVFGKYEDGATTASDAGVSAYNQFVRSIGRELASLSLQTEPASIPDSPGVGSPDIAFHATLADGKKVNVTALLVDNVSTAPQSFYARYEGLSTSADVIMYNGHAGLGQNVRALARKGKFVQGKYLITFMNGCDTFAYVDGSLAETRARINPDDPTGTKYMEIVTNAMPAFFHSMPNASLSLVRGLLKFNAPLTYDQIFTSIDRSQVVVVTGEEDNVFTPNVNPPPGPGEWKGLDESGTAAKSEEKRFSTPELPAGNYVFELSGDADADLYVRKGTAPTTRLYDCRPYEDGSAEKCQVRLETPAALHVMVRGYAAMSKFRLVGKKD